MIKGLKLEALRALYIIIGTILVSFALAVLYGPNGFVSGGASGLGLIINKVFGFPISVVVFCINIPLFILGYFFVNKRFFFRTLISFFLLIAGIEFFTSLNMHIPIADNLSISIAIGIIVGIGIGLVFKGNSSFGGSDIIAIILRKKFAIDIGHTLLAIDFVILGFSLFIYSPDAIIASFTSIFIYSQILSKILLGFNPKVTLMINTNAPHKIGTVLFHTLKREVTIIKVDNTFSSNQAIVWMTVPQTSLERVKELVNSIDDDAFISVMPTQIIMGFWRNNNLAKRSDLEEV